MSIQSNPFLQLVDEISRLQGRLKTLFAKFQDATGLSRMEQLVLASVRGSLVPPTVSQIGRSLGFPRQAIQRAANDLEKKGLIEKAHNPDHKRAPLLLATDKGLELKNKSDALALATANAMLGKVDAEMCQQISAEVRQLRKAIEAHLRSEESEK